ncbi:MAG: FAD-binding protein [Chloroflexi bacterium]|nr:FAD-binding protein [Chloroflexota bacterium]
MLTDSQLSQIRAIVGAENVHGGPAELIAYSYDGTFEQHPPDVAVTPASTEEVAAVMRFAYQEEIPVVTRGAGTNLSGGTIPLTGGIVLALTRMNRIIEIDHVNTCAVVEAGVVNGEFQARVESEGLFYPPDPSSLAQSTLGGNVACCAGGPRCLKYGVTKDYVLGMTVVLSSGEVLEWGGKLFKNVTGYNLAQLFIGSEGTLGVVTRIILRLLPLPRVRNTAVAFFPRLDDAAAAVVGVMGAGILPATLEIMDQATINVVEQYVRIGLPTDVEALLLLEQDGNDQDAVDREVARMVEVCRKHGASDVRMAKDAAERNELWRARRSISGALGRYRPSKLGEDIVVPRGQIPAVVRRIREIGQEFGLAIPVFGHAGDGNLHPNILFDFRVPGELERVQGAAAAIFRAAIALGGTLTGEHGVGSLKKEFLEEAVGPLAVQIMRDIKAALDPKGLLNQGKMFPSGSGPAMEDFLTALPTLQGITPG